MATDASRDANRVTSLIGVSSIDGRTTEYVTVTNNKLDVNASVSTTGLATSAKQDTQTTLLQGIAGFVPSTYDYVSLSYTSTNLTGVVFKTGGSGGTTVSTLTLAYDGSNNLTSVTKS